MEFEFPNYPEEKSSGDRCQVWVKTIWIHLELAYFPVDTF